MTIEQIIGAIGLVGFGGLLKSGFDFLIASRKAKQEARHTLKEPRYKAIILLCYYLIHYDREKVLLEARRPDINSIDRLRNELHTEFVNMALFASDNVILKMKEFIKQQNRKSLNDLAIAMRTDLYGIKTSLTNSDLDIETVQNK